MYRLEFKQSRKERIANLHSPLHPRELEKFHLFYLSPNFELIITVYSTFDNAKSSLMETEVLEKPRAEATSRIADDWSLHTLTQNDGKAREGEPASEKLKGGLSANNLQRLGHIRKTGMRTNQGYESCDLGFARPPFLSAGFNPHRI